MVDFSFSHAVLHHLQGAVIDEDTGDDVGPSELDSETKLSADTYDGADELLQSFHSLSNWKRTSHLSNQ